MRNDNNTLTLELALALFEMFGIIVTLDNGQVTALYFE